MAHPSHLCVLPLLVRAQVLILVYCIRSGSYTVAVGSYKLQLLKWYLSLWFCTSWLGKKKVLFALGPEHKLTLPASYFVTVQLFMRLLWSGSFAQILIYISGKECLLQRDKNIWIFIFRFNKPNLFNSQSSNVQLVSSFFSCSQIDLSSPGPEIPFREFTMLYDILLKQIW